MDARSADEGRSYFSKSGGKSRLGDKIVDERVTIYSDPTNLGITRFSLVGRWTAAGKNDVD